MNFRFFRVNFFLFILTYFFIALFLTLFTYKLLIKDFVKLDIEQDEKNIHTILNKVDIRISNIKTIVDDYGRWDDTYEFINGNNDSYIHEFFREGTNTLQELNLDFIVFATNENKVLYSKFLQKDETTSDKLLKNLVETFKKEKEASSVFKLKKDLFYIVKSKVVRSDSSGVPNGYIIGGKYINDKALQDFSELYESLNITSVKYYENAGLKYKLSNNNLITVKTEYESGFVLNRIQFFDLYGNYIFTINAKNPRSIITNGKNTIIILSSVMSLILFALMYILYRNQKFVEEQNEILEAKVSRRTHQLQKSLKSLKDKNRKLYKISNSDPLTKIANRRSFFKEAKKAFRLAHETKQDFNILLIDIDHFKKINDTYGHAIGDEVLKKFTEIVNSIIDEDVIFARIGGEEFCLAFKDLHFIYVSKIAENIRKQIANTSLKIDGKTINFTVSLGLANRRDCTHIDQILVVADEYLYKAKESGRNRLVRETIRK